MICTRCPLSAIAKKPIENRGDRKADVLIISDNPSQADEILENVLSGQDGKLLDMLFKDATDTLGIEPINYYATAMIRCRPTDTWRGETREPEYSEVLGCTYNLMNVVDKMRPRIIFLMGKLTDKYLKKEFPEAHTIQHISFLLKQGGKSSPWYNTNLRTIMEALKNGTKIV